VTMQRLFDLLLSGAALLVLSPLFLLVAIILRFTGEGEVFFRQERVGKDYKPFKLYKFATMLKDSPNVGTGTVTIKDDPRVLPIGKALRKTKINELPQLLNIMLGDMSIVGPRPQSHRCFDAFPKDLQQIIVQVKPGLSGIGPVVFRGEEDILADHAGSIEFYDNVIAPYKGLVEAWYVKNQSLSVYFKIILLTIWVVIFPSSSIVWKTFPFLPCPPSELKDSLNYCNATG
jgi:lipopolysaccharide/colanic/teichoic acid biosynthesis glycosyltransferase